MKSIDLVFVFLLCTLIAGCKKDSAPVPHNDRPDGYIVLKERDVNYPWKLFKRDNGLLSETQNSFDVLEFYDYLGRSYKWESYPMANPEKIGFQVIDVARFSRDEPTYFSKRKLGQGEATSFAYSGFQRYTENSKTTKKINGGFSLNLGLFSIGAKRNMSEVFSTSKIEESKRVFGELNVVIKDSAYIMQYSSNIRTQILNGYLTADFKEELYNTTPSELFYNYGGFVMAGFMTGGRATAVYTGLYNSTESEETKERDMNRDISASYGMNGTGASANLGIGKGFSNGTSSSNKITQLETSVKTIGGSYQFSGFTIPQDVNTINVDLSGWVRSLSDKSTHNIVDFPDGGLIPLTDFIVEENLKQEFFKIYQEGITKVTPMQEPYVLIRIVNIVSAQLGVFEITLRTRFGDYIILQQNYVYMGAANNFVNGQAERFGKIFGIKILTTADQRSVQQSSDGVVSTDKFFDENTMSKFIDKQNNTIYLLYSGERGKYAYSIHYDRLLDEYVMRNFVNGLPEVTISRQELLRYTIYAL